jgi:hypothetical protein
MNDLGFCKIRRSLREHLGRMSSDAVKLYLWLHLTAFWGGEKRGTVETSYSHISRELCWTIIRTKRAIRELRGNYVAIKKRGNQHKLTMIQILRYTKEASLAGITHDTSKTARITCEPSNDTSSGTSTSQIAANHAGFSTPKKAVEVKQQPVYLSPLNRKSRFGLSSGSNLAVRFPFDRFSKTGGPAATAGRIRS